MSIDDIAKTEETNVTDEKIGGLFPLSTLEGKRTPAGARNYLILCSTPEAAATIRERLVNPDYDALHVGTFENAPRYLSLAYKGEDAPQLQLLRAIASVIGDVDSKAYAFIPAERKSF